MTVALVANIARPISSVLSTAFNSDNVGLLAGYGILGVSNPDAVIEALFASGEQGAWYDPSDLSTMFQDMAGMTPVTAAGQTVRRINDKSGNEHHATSSVGTVLSVDENGKYYLQFNGSNSIFDTDTIDFSSTNKISLFSGVYMESESSQILFETSTDGNTNAGAFVVVYGWNGPLYKLAHAQSGFFDVSPSMIHPFKQVVSIALDTAGSAITDEVKVNCNKLDASISGGSSVTTQNYGNHALHIGGRVGNVWPFSGRIYSVILVGSSLDQTTTTSVQEWINTKAGIWSLTTPYEGQVATRVSMFEKKSSAGLTQVMSRKYHYARDTLSSIKLIFPNFYDGDAGIGASASVTASVEYPAGTFTQVLFSGSATGTIPDGDYLVSDAVSVSIPDGAKFYTRVFQSCASGFPYSEIQGDTTGGDITAWAISGLADKTMSNPMPANAVERYCYGPIGIVGMTTRPSVAIIGDSRQSGYSDIANDSTGNIGEVARSIGESLAYMQLGNTGESAQGFLLNASKRSLLISYCTNIISNFGVNSVFGGVTASTAFTQIKDLQGMFCKRFGQLTIPTETTSTDSFATLDNQTPVSGEAECLALNTLIRNGSSGFNYVFDIEGVVNDVNTGGNRAWIATYTTDGVHETNTANVAIKNSGIINPALIVR